MFENYKATRKDFEAIKEGIKTVWHPKMNFVFRKRKLIENAIVVSYDSKSVYLWTKIKVPNLKTFPCNFKKYYAYKIAHRVGLKNEWQLGWAAYLRQELDCLLPKEFQKSRFEIPKISGGLLRPFIELQKRKKVKNNPYNTRESFLATIVHEFAHIYWDQAKLWWYSDKKQNLAYLRLAEKLYQNERMVGDISLTLPTNVGLGELFAFCTEFYASGLFWPRHRRSLDLFFKERIKELIKLEQKKYLEKEDSVIEPTRNPHDFAGVLGRIIIHQYPRSWPRILTKFLPLTISS